MKPFCQLLKGDQRQKLFLQYPIYVAVKIIRMELRVQSDASTFHVTPKWRDAGRYS